MPSLLRKVFRIPNIAAARWRDRRVDFRYELAIGAIFKDEALYLDEWLTFHRGVGVEHFFLYDNGSTDCFREVLAPWLDAGIATLIDWPQLGGQEAAYQNCVLRYRMHARWIAFIDIDEFLFSPQRQDLRSILPAYGDLPAVFVYWRVFGSSGHVKRPPGSVIEAYTRRIDDRTANMERYLSPGVTGNGRQGKSIVNPRLVRKADLHKPVLWVGDTLDENHAPIFSLDGGTSCRVLRINHYWAKSIEDLHAKVRRGRAPHGQAPRDLEGSLKWEKKLNAVEDRTILPLWESIKKPGA